MKPTKMQRVASQQQNQQNVNPNVGGASSEATSSNVEVKANLDTMLEIGTDKRNSTKSNRGGKRKKVTPLEAQTSAATSANVQ